MSFHILPAKVHKNIQKSSFVNDFLSLINIKNQCSIIALC
ncbi:hypothetical protein SAMN04487902_103106 [Prevotella sp. ne3005]|nr:hypothetical protein SAMN04487902_103106 [Prevotella sp. ne3005]